LESAAGIRKIRIVEIEVQVVEKGT